MIVNIGIVFFLFDSFKRNEVVVFSEIQYMNPTEFVSSCKISSDDSLH